MTPPLAQVRRILKEERLGGWLFYYFRGNDPVAERFLALGGRFFTRRWFYLIPAAGAPVKVVHRIEPDALDHLPGRRVLYAGWRELEEALRSVLRGASPVAMQYSPRGAVPTLSRVDAGAVELVRSCGAAVASSGDLIQALEAVLTPAQKSQHRRTALALTETARDAFAFLRRGLLSGAALDERALQRRVLASFARRGLITNAPPIAAVNAHSALPHYMPPVKKSARIRRGDWVLLDLWAKPKGEESVYADITWCAHAGTSVPSREGNVFETVRRARDAAVDFVKGTYGKGKSVEGWRVDRAARAVIEKAGWGPYFTHRTGHSIHREDHADGANMDSFETRETRRLRPDTLFSIEPGVYLPGRFGARSEINVLLDGKKVEVTTPPQETPTAILA